MLAVMRKQPSKRAGGVTLKILLGHMQNMEHVLREEIRGSERGIRQDMQAFEHRVHRRFAQVDEALQNIDERLDDIEIRRLPRLEARGKR